jgi:predicted kinase
MVRTEQPRPLVHLVCGLNGAGKTTYARELQSTLPAVRFSLDEWMLRMYGLPFDAPGYGELAAHCKDLMWDLAQQVLSAGVDVVFDWNQWSRARRREWHSRATTAGHPVVLHYIRVSLETAISRAEDRARVGTPGSHLLDAHGIRHMASIFEEPTADEGVEILLTER